MKFLEIPNYPGYFACEDGEIYSGQPIGTQKGIQSKLRKLKKNIQTSGKYYIVNIKRYDGKILSNRIHRLICSAFHGNPPSNNSTCSHLDGNWKNNVPTNLCWESYSENLNRKKDHGTDDTGINNSRSKIDLQTLKDIRKLLKQQKLTHKQIGEKFGLSRVFITKIANGHRYKGQGL